MTKQQWVQAYRQARLVAGFEEFVQLGLQLTYDMDARAFSATVRYGDALAMGYCGTGHRCGRRRPRTIYGPRGVLPA